VEPIFVVALIATVITQVYSTVVRQRERLAAWRGAAVAAGLTGIEESKRWLTADWLRGWSGRHRVQFSKRGRSGTRITIDGNAPVTLQREGIATAVAKLMGKRDVTLGDDAFDSQVLVMGGSELLRAILDSETRSMVMDLLNGVIRIDGESAYGQADIVIRDGVLDADFGMNSGGPFEKQLPGILSTLLAVSRRLVRPEHVVERLVENTRYEPVWQVRLQNLQHLTECHRDHALTLDALKHACNDGDEDVRLYAALARGAEGGNTLLALAASPLASDSCAAHAVTGLAARLPLDRAIGILGAALSSERPTTARACIAAISAVAGLVTSLRAGQGELVADTAREPDFSGAEAAEAPLIAALRRVELAAAAAELLGRVGSVASVVPLQAAGAEGWADQELRDAAREAIALIQSRLAGAAPGQISLAGSATGQLSLTGDTCGQLSVAAPAVEADRPAHAAAPPNTIT
jgi:hypothetical protein